MSRCFFRYVVLNNSNVVTQVVIAIGVMGKKTF